MKKNVVRLLMSLVAILTMNTMLAENKLWLEQQPDGVMAVMMDNDSSAAALQFDVVLPDEVAIEDTEVDGSNQKVYRNPERLNNTQIFKCAKSGNFENAYTVIIVSMDQKPFVGTSGPVAFFKVRSQVETPVELKLEKIIMTTGNGTKLDVNSNWAGKFSFSSVFVEFYSPYADNQVAVVPGKTLELPFDLRNSEEIAGFQLDVKLPEGFSMSDKFTLDPRMSNSSVISVTYNEKDNIYRLIAVDLFTNRAVRDAGEGTVFTANINVPETVAEGAVITVGNVYASTMGNASIMGVGCTLNVVDGTNPYNAVKDQIASLQKLLDDAIAEIAKDYAGFEPTEDIEQVQAMIDAASAEADAAYAALPKTGVFDYTVDEKPIKDAIAELIPAAAAAKEQDRVAKNKAAYEIDLDAIDELLTNYRAIVNQIHTEYPDYEDLSAELAVRNSIDDAKAAVEKAYKAVAEAGEYESPLDVAALQASIDQLLIDAKDKFDGVETIEAEAGEGAMYFTVDGQRHERPVSGELNVVVRKNGETSKILVK